MKITINGKAVEIERAMSVSDLLRSKGCAEALVAVERNLEWLRREQWPEVVLREDDRLEIVRIMAGGSEGTERPLDDSLRIGGRLLSSRLFVGTGKFTSYDLIPRAVRASGAQVVTIALRRMDFDAPEENMVSYLPEDAILMTNTSGARSAAEAVRIARLARAAGCGDWIKIEVVSDQKYLLPDNYETIKATEMLAAEGFVVLPYISPDLMVAKKLVEVGAAAVMPLGSPIGSNRGLRTKELVRILVAEIDRPVIVDAGIGRPSEAAEAMEMGCAAVLVNTAIATAHDPIAMAHAFALAVEAGRLAFLSGPAPANSAAVASSPLTGFLRDAVETSIP